MTQYSAYNGPLLAVIQWDRIHGMLLALFISAYYKEFHAPHLCTKVIVWHRLPKEITPNNLLPVAPQKRSKVRQRPLVSPEAAVSY